MPPPQSREAAEEALVTAAARPADGRDEAIRVLRSATDEEARVIATRALGNCYQHLGLLHTALHHLRRSVRRADRAGLARRAAESRMTLAGVLTEYGDVRGALAVLDEAAEVFTGLDADRLLGQRAYVLARMGRFEEALACYRRAIPRMRRGGPPHLLSTMLLNRGNINTYIGQLHQAESDLQSCQRVAEQADLAGTVAVARLNLAKVARQRGDIPRSLALLDEAERRLEETQKRVAFARVVRAQSLLQANLAGEAREVLRQSVQQLEAAGFHADCAEARMSLAHAELLDRDPQQAAATAHEAYWTFIRQRRTGWAYHAEHIKILARWYAGERSTSLLRDAQRSTTNLLRWGWEDAAAHNRVITGRLALEAGELDAADLEFAEVGKARLSGPVHLRVAAWHATALQRLARGDRRGAAAALRAGLRVVDEYAGSLGATDLRVHAIGWGRELANLGMTLALSSRRARTVFAWTERWRAGAIRHRPVRPPDDLRLATALTELRQVTAELGSAVAEGRSVRKLRGRQVRLEDEIRRRCRHAHGTYQGPRPAPSLTELSESLGDRAFVSYAEADGALVAVAVAGGKARLTHVCAYRDALRTMEALRFCIHRLARRHGSAESLDAARLGVGHSAGELNRLLVEPLARHVGDRELVLAPTGRLHAMPWSALPSLTGRPLTVTPSAAMWLSTLRADQPRETTGSLLVAGPGLEHAVTEVDAMAAYYPRSTRLTGIEAAAETVRTAMDGADLAHLAAHGRFRGDNPLFSSIDLADGPLMVYDMETLQRAPRRMVLSACDSAVSAVRPGNELMGLASALLSLGTATLVASVSPVHDEETETLMVAFHERLARGLSPSAALAEATRTSGVLGFTCFGAG